MLVSTDLGKSVTAAGAKIIIIIALSGRPLLLGMKIFHYSDTHEAVTQLHNYHSLMTAVMVPVI